jgi:hypothetical protein
MAAGRRASIVAADASTRDGGTIIAGHASASMAAGTSP